MAPLNASGTPVLFDPTKFELEAGADGVVGEHLHGLERIVVGSLTG
jgi:hypothetical protein